MLKPIKILLTSCGRPGSAMMIKMLRANGERDVEIIGVDMDHEAVGRFLCDGFYQVPACSDDKYTDCMFEICRAERPDVIYPQGSYDVPKLAAAIGKFSGLRVKIAVSDLRSVNTANNKYETYQALSRAGVDGIPDYYWPKNMAEFLEYADRLGYPIQPIVIKPHVDKGDRGVRVIDAGIDKAKPIMNHKPGDWHMSMSEFLNVDIFSHPETRDMMLMEYCEGEEASVDCLCLDGNPLLTMVKTVERVRWGVSVRSELVDRPELVERTREILNVIPLSYNVNLQFIGNQLIEINPRTSTYVYQDDLTPPCLAIKLALGEITPDEIRAYQDRIAYGRRPVRFIEQVFYNKLPGQDSNLESPD